MSKKLTDTNITTEEILNLQAMNLTQARKFLRLKQLELDALLETTQAINNNYSTKTLFQIYEFNLRTRLGIKKLAVYIKSKDWQCVSSYGVDKKILNIDIEKDLISIKKITDISDSTNKNLKDFEVVIPVYHKNIPLSYILIGDYAQTQEESKSDIRFVQTISNIICVAIENKKLVRREIQEEGLRKELELAAQMQTMLFPTILPNDDHLEMAAKYLPHRDIGGDYYDFIRLNNQEIVFCIADVSGKGFAAGLIMASFQANFHALLLENCTLVDLVQTLNTKVRNTAKYEKFITFFVGKYNIKSGILQYINAGHNPPILYTDKKTHLLNDGATVLGMFDKLPFIKTGEFQIKEDSFILCYTDGLIEVENNANQPFELDRLCDYVIKNVNMSVNDFNETLIKEVNNFKESNQFTDDVTLLSCKIFR